MLPTDAPTLEICASEKLDVASQWIANSAGRYALGPVECRASEVALDFEKIADGVYVHTGQIDVPNAENYGDLSNIGLIVGNDSVAVFDSGGSRAVGEAALAGIRKITDLPISHVFLSHMHPDHIYGATVFAEAGALVVGHQNLQQALTNRAENYAESLSRLIGPQQFLGSEIPKIDIALEEDRTFDLGGRQLEAKVIATAHTDNDLIVIDQDSKILFASDLVFLMHTPALDGSLRGWQAVMAELAQADVKTVVPGHGPVTPFPDALEPTRRYLDVLARSTKDHLKRGLSLSESAPEIAKSERDNWLLFEEFNERNATGAYTELEWE